MSDLLRKLLEDRKELLSEEDNLPIDNPEVKDENPEEPDELNVIEEPEQEGIPDDFEKVYLGKSGDKHYYIIAKRNEEGVVEDLELTDQEGNKVYSAKENELEVTNLGSFIREVLNEEDIPEVETSVVMQYLVPDIQDEIEAEEEEDEELETPEEIPGEEEKPEDNSKVPTPNDTEKKKLPFESKIKEGTGEDIYQKALEEAIRQMELYVGRSIPFKAIKNSIKRTYQLSDEEAEGIIYDAADEEHLDLGSQPNFDESKVKETNVKDTPEHIKVNCKACGKRVSDDTKLNPEGLCPKCARSMPKWNESKDRLPGGKADKKKPEDFDKAQLEIGIEIEMEHTDDPAVAQEIAMDHLTEDPEYYTHLRKMEMDAKNGKGFAKESKETNEARMGVDYIKGVKSSVKTAIQALKDKDYEAAAKALEDVADDAGDAAKAAKKMKREVDAKEEASKEETEEVKESQLTETVIKDDKGNTFTITKTVDEKTKNTILQINKRDFSFTPDFVKVFETDENGELSENGAKELALETIKHLEESEYADLIASGKVKESKVNENEESKMKESDKSQAEKTYLAKIEAALEKAKTELEKNPDSKELQKRVQSLEAALDEDYNECASKNESKVNEMLYEDQFVGPDGKTVVEDFNDAGRFDLTRAGEICTAHEGAVISPEAGGKWMVILQNKGEGSEYNECASKNESIKIAIQAGLIKEGTELMYNSKKCKVTAITESNVSLTVADEAGSSMNVNINGNNGGVNIDPTGMISITPANVGMGFEEAPVTEPVDDEGLEDVEDEITPENNEEPTEEELENPEEEKEEENPFESKVKECGDEKVVFAVSYVTKDGEAQTTRVMAYDEADAKVMISKKPTVKSVSDAKRISEATQAINKPVKKEKKVEKIVKPVTKTKQLAESEKTVLENKEAFGGERAVRIAESILGLSKHVIEDDAVDVGKMVQITNKHSGRVMIVESKVQKMDKTKGCLVDGDWYSEKFYNIYTI